MDVSYPGDFYPKWRTEDASRNLANSMAGNTFWCTNKLLTLSFKYNVMDMVETVVQNIERVQRRHETNFALFEKSILFFLL